MSETIAIIGISCELPGGPDSTLNLDHDGFFEFLLNYGEAYEKIPSNRFNIESWSGSEPGQISVDTGAFLKDIDLFDNFEFGLSTKDTKAMAATTRKLIEHSFLALLDSGIDYRNKNIGCYMSASLGDLMTVAEPDEFDAVGSFTGYPALVANQVSYTLDLLGPSLPTDTACSSTATATHLAVQALRSGDCDAAVVGGCQLNHRFMDWINYSQGSLLAPDGKCKPFDASADGFARAEGCVVFILKPLEKALRDNDLIYGTIISTAINSSGSRAPAGAPVADRQRDVMLEAFKRVSRNPQDVDYVELHATGTAKGDPTEANWVGKHFSRNRELIVGSVKGNIGHTEIVAFAASLSKVLSIFKHRVIPPNVNFSTPNPAIEWAKYQLRVPTQPTPLPCSPDKVPLISMSSFGIGGANAHVILEGPPARTEISSQTCAGPVLLMASGLSSRTASTAAEDLARTFSTVPSNAKAAMSVTLGRRSKQMLWRTSAVVTDSTSSVEFLPALLSPRDTNKIVFIFSGQGPQYRDMGRQLFQIFPVFRENVLEMDAVFRALTQKSLIADYGLFDGQSTPLVEPWPISLILPSIAVFQIALYELLSFLNIKPDIVMGHSAGETAVLYVSGAASKAMAVELAIIRGRVFSSIESADGTMAALSCGAEQALELIAAETPVGRDMVADIACYNSPSDVAIAGHKPALQRIVQAAGERGIYARIIRTNVPIHSSMMESCRTAYEAELSSLFERYPALHIPLLPTVSTLTGSVWSGPYDAAYFWKSTRDPVLFTSALETLTTLESGLTFVEISPHPVLSSYISRTLDNPDFVLSPVRRPPAGNSQSEHSDLLSFCGRLTVLGHNCVDFQALNGIGYSTAVSIASLPPYPFSKKAFPLYPDTPGVAKQMASRRGPLNSDYLRINKSTHPVLAEHVIRGESIMPAAGFLEMAIEFGASALMDVNFRSILALSSPTPIRVKVPLDGCRWNVMSSPSVNISTRAGSLPADKLHADGYLSFEQPSVVADIDIPAIRARCPEHVSTDFYESLSYFSSYGPRFQRVMSAYYGHQEALVSIKGWDKSLGVEEYVLHPAVLDAAFHIMDYKHFTGDLNPNTYFLPSSVKTLLIHMPLKRNYFPAFVYAHVTLISWAPGSLTADIVMTDDGGRVLCSMRGFQFDQHRIYALPIDYNPLDILSQSVMRGTPTEYQHNPEVLIRAPATNDDPGPALIEALEHHLSSMNEDHRILRILFNLAAAPFLETLTGIFAEHDHYYEVYLPTSTTVILPWDLGIVRVTPIDFSHPTDEDIVDGFDILIALDESSLPLESYGPLLRPTGVLLSLTPGQSPGWCCRTIGFNIDDPPRLYNPNSFVFGYTFGEEMMLQWDFSGLNVLQRLDIWVLTDHPAALGLIRAVRFEYPAWSIRLVLFAPTFPVDRREELVNQLPYSLRQEPEFFVSESGEVRVPRMIPFTRLADHRRISATDNYFGSQKLRDSVGMGDETGFIEEVHSLISAVLARNQALHSKPVSNLRILLTHADTRYGYFINLFYSVLGYQVTRIAKDARLSELAAAGNRNFDLVISGYTELEYSQILQLLVQPQGTIFLWNRAEEIISRDLRLNSVAVQRALEEAVLFLEEHIEDISSSLLPASPLSSNPTSLSFLQPSTFGNEFTYLIIGGIGHVGAHIALYLYQHGARYITVTSRSGRAGVSGAATIVRRIFEYLDQLPDLELQYEAVDATSEPKMRYLIQHLTPPPRGLFVLTSTLVDGTFASLHSQQFEESFRSKLSVLDVLPRAVDVDSLDFLVAFSSVSGTFGNAGQSAYDATNSALEYMVEKIPRAFTFICPGLSDSSMLLRHGDILLPWAISTEEMILWLHDALSRYLEGARFHRYLPNLNWGIMDKVHGMSLIGQHLVPSVQSVTVDLGDTTERDEQDTIRRIVQQNLNIPASDMMDDIPLVAYGIDSLSAARLSFLLRPFTQVSQIQLLANLSLNDIFVKIDRPTQLGPVEKVKAVPFDPQDVYVQDLQRWLDILQDNTLDWTLSPRFDLPDSASGLNTVVLTGTTGFLGAHILQELLIRSDVHSVYAINRVDSAGSSILQRQNSVFRQYGLNVSLVTSPKLVLVEVDMASNGLNIADKTRNEIIHSATHFIHSAWNVKFSAPAAEFNDLIQGTLALLHLAAAAKASFTFISTIGVYHGSQRSSPCMEEPIENSPHLPSAYSQSKWLAERLVHMGSEILGISTKVVRVGLLTGAENGYWDVSHWLPALVGSGSHVGCLPDGDGLVSWIPVHVAACAIIDFHDSPEKTLHLVHPYPSTWSSLMSLIAGDLGLQLVPYTEWLARLEYMAQSSFNFESGYSSIKPEDGISAVKLLEFYRTATAHPAKKRTIEQKDAESLGLLPLVAIHKGLCASQSMRSARALSRVDVHAWMSYWRSVGLVQSHV